MGGLTDGRMEGEFPREYLFSHAVVNQRAFPGSVPRSWGEVI